ncbi:hypothetical protein ACTHPJ_02735 [Paenibacillus amylolyticus]
MQKKTIPLQFSTAIRDSLWSDRSPSDFNSMLRSTRERTLRQHVVQPYKRVIRMKIRPYLLNRPRPINSSHIHLRWNYTSARSFNVSS